MSVDQIFLVGLTKLSALKFGIQILPQKRDFSHQVKEFVREVLKIWGNKV